MRSLFSASGLVLAVAIFALLHHALPVSGEDSKAIQQHDVMGVDYVQALLIDDVSAMEMESEVSPSAKKSSASASSAPKKAAKGKKLAAAGVAAPITADNGDFSETAMRAKFEEFKKKKRKPYKSSATEAAGYQRFKKNRLHVNNLNTKLGKQANVFSSTAKFADMDPSEFAAKYLGQKVPVGSSHGKPVLSAGIKAPAGKGKAATTTARARSRTLSPQTAGAKAKGKASTKLKRRSRQLSLEPSSLLESESGQQPAQSVQPAQTNPSGPTHQAGGLSGDSGGKSGKTGGNSGGTGFKSGKTGGDSGGVGFKSGKTGGDSGGVGFKSGKTGGDAGGVGKKSGKTGGDAGSTGKKSGKTGGTSGDAGSKSGKTGGTDSTVKPALPTAPTGNISYTPIGTGGLLNADQLRAQLKKYGVSDDDINFAMDPTRHIETTINNQAGDQALDCGSCWAYSTIKMLNAMNTEAHFRNLKAGDTLTVPSYSVQQLLDCVKSKQTKGCGGGTPMDALDFLSKNPIATSAEYPIRADGKAGTCAPPPSVASNPILSWGWSMAIPECSSKGDCTSQVAREVELVKFLSSGGHNNFMAIAYVDATNWQNYQAGLFPPDYCSNTMEAGNHLVFIDSFLWSNGVPYWLIANSWGSDWGRFGNIWLPAFTNACGVANFVIIPNPPPPDKANLLGFVKL